MVVQDLTCEFLLVMSIKDILKDKILKQKLLKALEETSSTSDKDKGQGIMVTTSIILRQLLVMNVSSSAAA